jgi:hypothetical protein
VPFEVKYRHAGSGDITGLVEFCREKSPERAYLITKELSDFGVEPVTGTNTALIRVPAALACYWLGASEIRAP